MLMQPLMTFYEMDVSERMSYKAYNVKQCFLSNNNIYRNIRLGRFNAVSRRANGGGPYPVGMICKF